jgi:hypothetical protein
VLWALWWISIRPSNDRQWAADVAHQAVGVIDGDTLRMRNVRNFDWHTETAFAERWEACTYDLGTLEHMDLFVCRWAGPYMAHLIVSFVFADGRCLAFSIETRRERSEAWSSFAGFFKAYELIIIAADERDVVRVRTNVRGEDVRLYRLATHADMRRNILERYVTDSNALINRPRFYHTIWSNCTTQIARIIWAAGRRFPLDWRIIVSGYVPNYLYGMGLLDTSQPFAELYRLADIVPRAKAADADADFSALIREGVPTPPPPDTLSG